ncbi:putative HTH-type transcriptional regulator YbbH [Rosistilla ulvae]|uniref:Putative HTH-type transcriptional regulator YbbH n=1 Tax=Rosistilla ulvae TaxID=1930277 RepID=A0A517M7L8_9BACT|nr:MurR/RpiR family transcriptional regulator [Rosistilla ulvae]QDS90863.1 putative HTH-type transcriptional regulator YbbH [Rosistilla ulvae]
MSTPAAQSSSYPDESWRKKFRRLHGELTNAEQRAGEYFEKHPESAYHSITEVVAISGIGYGTVIRFCQKLGCKGFQDFKLMLATDEAVNVRAERDPNDRQGSEVERRLKNDLSETLRLLDDHDLQLAAERLLACRVVQIVGVASSAPLVTGLAWKLVRIGIDARPSTEGYVMAVNATLLDESDVLIAISSSGATKDILHAASVAETQQATVIALTNFPNSPLSQIADISLITTANRDPIKAEIPSIIAGEAVAEMLLDRLLTLAPERLDHILQSSKAVSDRKL